MAVQLHNELKGEGFIVAPLHPGELIPLPSAQITTNVVSLTGWVATDMGKQAGDGGMPAEKSAAGLAKVIAGLDSSKSGRFYDWAGEGLPW